MPARLRLIGVVLALFAWIGSLVAPVYSHSTSTPEGTESAGTATLIEVNGWAAAIPGLIFLALAVGVWRGPNLVARWVCLGVFLFFIAFTMFSIGLFFLPAALLLILGISMDTGESDARA
ncbi:MAG: hypothetical protein Q4G67_11070 [Actinomycetia bacterium]|nr:hypothetical protein [Actinomycetes bacterium]